MKNSRFDRDRFIEQLLEFAPRFGLSLSGSLLDKLATHYQLLVSWNQKLNLTTIVDPAKAARFHYLESLYGASYLESDMSRVIDVGSGAGFPGLPMAILHPTMQITLIEKNRKKVFFLLEAIRKLNLSNSSVFDGRLEDYKDRAFDALTCRALDNMQEQIPRLLEMGRMCRQIIFFCNRAISLFVEQTSVRTWQSRHLQVPLSTDRFLTILHQ